MKPTKVTYKKIFPIGSYQNESIGVEMDLDDTDSPDAAFEECKRLVEKWGTNGQTIEWPTVPLNGSATVQNSIDYKVIETLEKLIDDAQNISELDMYYGDIVKHGMLEEYQTKKQALSPLPKQR